MSSQVLNSTERAFRLLEIALEKVLDNEIKEITIVPNKLEMDREELNKVEEYLEELGYSYDPQNGSFEKATGGECIRVQLNVDGYGNLISISVSRSGLESCSKHLLAKLLRDLWIKEVEA